jgi:hypothetical protein
MPTDLDIPFDRVTYRNGQLLAVQDLRDDHRNAFRRNALHHVICTKPGVLRLVSRSDYWRTEARLPSTRVMPSTSWGATSCLRRASSSLCPMSETLNALRSRSAIRTILPSETDATWPQSVWGTG